MTPTSIITSHYVTHTFASWMAGIICVMNSVIQRPSITFANWKLIRLRGKNSILRQKIPFTQFKWYSSLQSPVYSPCNRAKFCLFGSLILGKFLRICFPRMKDIIDRPIHFWMIVILHAAHLLPTKNIYAIMKIKLKTSLSQKALQAKLQRVM